MRLSDARQQRPEQQYRPAQPPHERTVRRMRPNPWSPHPQRRRSDAVDFRAEIQEQPRHNLDVTDTGDVGEDALLVREEACRKQGKRGVLVASDEDLPFEPVPALNQECRH